MAPPEEIMTKSPLTDKRKEKYYSVKNRKKLRMEIWCEGIGQFKLIDVIDVGVELLTKYPRITRDRMSMKSRGLESNDRMCMKSRGLESNDRMCMKSRGMKSNDRISMKSHGMESIDRMKMKTCGLESNDRMSMKPRGMESSDRMSMKSWGILGNGEQ